MHLVNISNSRRIVYLFCRDDKGNLIIDKDNSFFPYFFEPDQQGKFKGVDGTLLKKVFASEPSEVSKMRSENSYESDILFTRRYMLDKIKSLDKTIIKYAFIDIETLAEELPNTDRALYPISCISVYNSMNEKIQTWYLGDYGLKNEETMIKDFISYMKREKFDLWLSWNSSFDYNYIYNRCQSLDIDFAKEISPIGRVRKQRDVFYPAGISIVDYLRWFKKIYMREMTYTLDYIAEKYLGKGKTYKEVDFSKLNPDIKLRNAEDVAILRDLEKKYKLIPYYDEIRRLSKVAWEDLYYPSRVIEMLLLEESKNKKVVLPMKIKHEKGKKLKAAVREALELGVFKDISKYDLSSAYPSMIIDFCLDPVNVYSQKTNDCLEIGVKDKEGNIIGTYWYKQNSDAVLPTAVKKLLVIKNKLKKEKKTIDPKSKEFKDIKLKYNAIKGVTNSAFGCFENPFFRLYDQRITSTITYLVRDLLIYVKDKLQEKGYKVIYYDTDGIMLNTKENLTNLLNDLVQQWAKTKYNKSASIEFEYEGYYTKLFIVALCHYSGDLQTSEGIEKEVKGLEIKRKDSSKFMAKFQKDLIEKCKSQEPKEDIVNFVKSEMERIKTVPLEEIALPCKLAKKPEDYLNVPIFVRALNTAQELTKFKKRIGEIYWWIYTLPSGSVTAFDKKKKDHIKDIDWNQAIRRNILMKAQTIFEALKWDIKEIIPIELLKPVSKTLAKRIQIEIDPNQGKFNFLEKGGEKSGQ